MSNAITICLDISKRFLQFGIPADFASAMKVSFEPETYFIVTSNSPL